MNRLVEAIPPSAIRMLNDHRQAFTIDLGMGQPAAPSRHGALGSCAQRWIREHGCPYSPNAG